MDIDKCRKTRTAAKSRLTLSTNKIKDLIDVVGEDISFTELDYAINNFQERLSIYDSAQNAVEELLNVDEIQEEVEQSEKFREERLISFIRAKELLEVKGKFVKKEKNSETSRSSTLHQAKLPQIELPKFAGDHTQWQSFWDKFTAIVHLSDLPAVSKFTYLQSLVKGEALAAISGLALTEANYETARDLLQQRFGRKERIISSHIQQLLNLSTPGRSTQDLWSIFDKLQTHIRSLETLDITGDAYGVILTPIVLHKLPESIRMEWARQGDGKETNLDALLSFLHTEIIRRERSQSFRSDQLSSRVEHKTTGKYATASTLHSSGQRKDQQTTCNVCGKGHVTDKCISWNNLELEGRKSLCFKHGLCFLCFGLHRLRNCNNRRSCIKCSGRHHRLLCPQPSNSSNVSDGLSEQAGTSSLPALHTSSNVGTTTRHSLLQTAQVMVRLNPNNIAKVNLLFDSGSDRSYISSSCAKTLGLKTVGKESVSVALFGQSKPNQPKIRNKFKIEFICRDLTTEEMIVTESPMICAPIRKSMLPKEILEKLRRENLTLAEGSLVDSDIQLEIDILVGLDYYWQFVQPNACPITEYLSAQESKFGWILSGSWVQKDKRSSLSYQFLCMTDIPENVCHQFWNLDVIGIEGSVKEGEGQCNADLVLGEFKNSIVFEDGRYKVHLPWKKGQREKLIDNKALAIKRSESLTKRLSKDPALQVGYNKVLQELEESGIVHEIPDEERASENPIFYLPHRPVVREGSATTKIRPVFDASAKGSNGISLNDCMETGPNLIPNLTEILLRFRRWKYGLTADITKAFLQIKVVKEDQDVHRFIWDVQGQRRIMRFDRVIFGNACSPFLLNATIKCHLNSCQNSKVSNELTDNLYVDDWLSGADTEEEIENMITTASEIMSRGGFPLSKWGSSSSSVSHNLSKGFDHSTEISPALKILGMYWSTKGDYFYFDADHTLFEGVQYTKRLVLSFIARIYDPMGFLNPFTVLIKILFQDLWRLGLEWDEPVPAEMQKQMSVWAQGFRDIRRWKIPRSLSIQSWGGSRNMQLLCFSDASERAFGCCVYLGVSENGLRKMSLVASRVRVAPLKRITLPRLELLGALLAARLLCFVKTALHLPFEIPYLCFTDSTIALHWIKSDPHRWKQFVGNRVTEIQSLTNPSYWKHIPGKGNPADLLTRGVCASQLTNSVEWLQGPKDLEVLDLNLEEELQEEDFLSERVRKSDPVLLNVQDTHSSIDFKKFGHCPRLIKVIGWVLRFVNNLKSSITNEGLNKAQGLASEELEAAKVCLFQIVQRESFNEEIERLSQGRLVSNKSPLFKLTPFLDEKGLLRLGGRLHLSEHYTYDEKHPIVLPKCHVTLLLVRFQHQLLKHAGVSVLLTSLRNNYWIFGLRVLCKRVCRECVLCQRQDARACNQIRAPLPPDRIDKSHPFSVVGVDHAGPLYCQDTGDKKHYILLFTCGTIRAVHLELVPSLSLTDFMLALRKFISRRGLPSVIYSDNARTFEAAKSLVEQFGPAAPKWKFSIPLAPWYGGWWERLVRSTKSALRKSIGKVLINRSELETILYEVEACLNSRPLTYVGEYNDNKPLTPSHFLIGRSSPFNVVQVGAPLQNYDEFCIADKEQRASLEKFWNIWSEDYIRNLPSLGNGKSKVDLSVGSLVLIREEGKPRLKWPMGKVTKVLHSKDGLIRAVSLKTEKGELVRAVQKLHKLEVSENAIVTEIPDRTSETECASSRSIPDRSPETECVSSRSVPDRTPSSRSGRMIKPPRILDL